MRFKATPSWGGWIGLGLTLAVGGLWAWSVLAIRSGGLGPRAALLGLLAFALTPLVLLLAYWTWGFFNLRYELSRDGLIIRWAGSRQVIPMAEVTHLLAGKDFEGPLRGLRWPGYALGRTMVRDEAGEPRVTLAYTTAPTEGQLLILTRSLAYAISPEDPRAFVEDFKRRRSLGPMRPLEQRTQPARWAALSLWNDPRALRLLIIAAMLNALAFAWIAWQYPGLPERLVVQYRYDPVLGAPTAGPSQAPHTLWRLPLIALAALGLDVVLAAGVHARSRLAALLLLAGAICVQIGLLLVLGRVV